NINCLMWFDADDGGASSWCGGPAPAEYVITLDGGARAWLLAAQSFTVGATGAMRMQGALPVIIASYASGQTLIDGAMLVDSDRNLDGGAGSRTATDCGAQAGGDSVN